MNVNYIGSLAQRKFQFSSDVTVQNIDSSDLFNSVSIYLPKSFSAASLVGFNPAIVNATTPALLVLTVDNYETEAQGDFLSQITPMFNNGSNIDITVYVIVFDDVDGTPTMWATGTTSITFSPLTTAFQGLYFISYVKMLYDPTYDGSDVTVPGSASTITLQFTNPTAGSLTIPAGAYAVTVGDKTFDFTLATAQVVAAAGVVSNIVGTATVNGTTTASTSSVPVVTNFTPNLPTGFTIAVTAVTQGVADTTRPSTYFQLALALAYQALTNVKLSVFYCIAMLDFTKINDAAGTDTNKCQIRKLSLAQEIAAATSLATVDPAANFYGALYLMKAQNTCVVADCVPTRNVLSIIIGAWFGSKNSSGNYVGNKLSLLRLVSQNCFGPVSPINGQYNSGDPTGYSVFDSKNVGVLEPISGSNSGDSAISMMRGVLGMPVNALMIAKWVDYNSAQACANMITDQGTLTNPVLTNNQAYLKIQNIVMGYLGLFAGTQRITSIQALFPAFSAAKVGSTALQAASSWSAVYVDDLDTVNVSGGITAE